MKNFALGVLTGVAGYFAFGVYALHRMNKVDPIGMEDFYNSVNDEFFKGRDNSEAVETLMKF